MFIFCLLGLGASLAYGGLILYKREYKGTRRQEECTSTLLSNQVHIWHISTHLIHLHLLSNQVHISYTSALLSNHITSPPSSPSTHLAHLHPPLKPGTHLHSPLNSGNKLHPHLKTGTTSNQTTPPPSCQIKFSPLSSSQTRYTHPPSFQTRDTPLSLTN